MPTLLQPLFGLCAALFTYMSVSWPPNLLLPTFSQMGKWVCHSLIVQIINPHLSHCPHHYLLFLHSHVELWSFYINTRVPWFIIPTHPSKNSLLQLQGVSPAVSPTCLLFDLLTPVTRQSEGLVTKPLSSPHDHPLTQPQSWHESTLERVVHMEITPCPTSTMTGFLCERQSCDHTLVGVRLITSSRGVNLGMQARRCYSVCVPVCPSHFTF